MKQIPYYERLAITTKQIWKRARRRRGMTVYSMEDGEHGPVRVRRTITTKRLTWGEARKLARGGAEDGKGCDYREPPAPRKARAALADGS